MESVTAKNASNNNAWPVAQLRHKKPPRIRPRWELRLIQLRYRLASCVYRLLPSNRPACLACKLCILDRHWAKRPLLLDTLKRYRTGKELLAHFNGVHEW